ncbi:hypothetical protein HaLaN_26417 [Haematococcus lacustris]|uniref:Uncharacterized protein n=1 Tax=Haematococcus lacustris TaxID=44745 RepID=A0A6A0A663_HAELA|nr:hypothetical protein HaLaN_26417 [Haematococcus lacustris]
MSLVAQCLRGSSPVPRSNSRFRLKARENEVRRSRVWSAATVQSSELRAAHIAAVHASAGPSTPPGKQHEEQRAEWKTQRRQVRTGPHTALYAPALSSKSEGWGAQPAPRHRVTVCAQDLPDMLGGILHPGVPQCPNTSSRAASPRTGCCTPTPTPHAARLAARHPPPAAPTGPPMPLDCEDPVLLQQLQVFCMYVANFNFLTPYNQVQRRLGRPNQNLHYSIKPAFDDPSNQELLAKLQQLGSANFTGDANTISHHSMQLAVEGRGAGVGSKRLAGCATQGQGEHHMSTC